MSEFISEDDLKTFEGWLRYQAIDPKLCTPNTLQQMRDIFDEISASATPTVGLMKLRARPGEYLYGVAVRESGELSLTLWVRRSSKGEIFIMVPRAKKGWDPHNSYHRDGRFHAKSFDHKLGEPQRRQPLTAAFRGTEHLGCYAGHGPKSVGAVCDPAAFAGILEVPAGILGPKDGAISVDLVEPGVKPIPWPMSNGRLVCEATFKDVEPWLVLRAGTTSKTE